MRKILLFGAALLMAAVSMAQTPTVSASKVTFRYCESTSSSITVNAFEMPATWEGKTYNETGVYVESIENARGCDSIVTLTIVDTQGAIAFPFTVASGKQVYFSRGNLQYCANPTSGDKSHVVRDNELKPGIWRFALNQWDFVGGQDANAIAGNVYENGELCDNLQRGASYSGWIDLFRRGTSGASLYSPYGFYCNGNQLNDYYDWGKYNAISNGGNVFGMWRTLTKEEWEYLRGSRPNANSLRATGVVNNVTGAIILPDNWVLPDGCSFTALASTNIYTIDEWKKMEAAGAVFLPVTGYMRYNPYLTYSGTQYDKYILSGSTYYWESSFHESPSGFPSRYSHYAISIRTDGAAFQSAYVSNDLNSSEALISNGDYNQYYYFCPVRLVRDVQ